MSIILNNYKNKAINTAIFSILSNACLAIIKWLAGIFGNSYALIADAIESTTDTFASLLVLFGIKYTQKPADANHPYGHGRLEPLITFMVVAFLVISAMLITFQSIENIGTPHDSPKLFTLFILAPIIIWKEISYQLVIRRAKLIGSTVLKADAWHHRSDAITSVAAFIGISIALILGKGFESADDWAALFSAGFIFYNAYRIFRPALGEIMDEHLYDDLVKNIRKISATIEGVIDTEKCLIRKTGTTYFADLHITVDAHITVKEGHDIAHALKEKLKVEIPQLEDILIHVEPNEY
ncbi:MAG: cation diffusion facilitator family transporter [Bacteroidia bacterium]|nr:cation diffusion facilitator family transporter [Bacteroidota bacterium]MCZ2129070.1 cation diffusion facilitator family transporter [Bacteroidia bacterium]